MSASRQRRVDWGSLGVGAIGLVLIVASLALTIYRYSLPWDGWSYTRDLSGAGLHLVFNENIAAPSIAIRRGDLLLTAAGQSVDQLLTGALTGQPQRPANWQVDEYVTYRVLRSAFGGDYVLTIIVPLVHYWPAQTLLAILQGLLTNLTILPPFLIALFVFARRPRDYSARLLYLLTACYLSSEGISHAVTHSNVVGPAELYDAAAFWGGQFFNSLIWPFLIAPIYVNLFWRFPIPKRPLREHQRATLLLLYGFVPALTFAVWLATHDQPLVFWNAWSNLSGAVFIATLLVGIASVAHSWWTAHNYAERLQIRWVAFGVILTSVGMLIAGTLASLGILGTDPLIDFLFYQLPVLSLPITLAIAIYRYRLWDLEVIVRRTLIYGVLTAALLVIYFASVIVLEQIVISVGGEQESEWITVVSTLVIAAMFVPLRARVQATIDRHFYRRKHNAAQILAAFGDSVRDEVDLNSLQRHLLSTVEDALQPESVSLWLKQPDPERER